MSWTCYLNFFTPRRLCSFDSFLVGSERSLQVERGREVEESKKVQNVVIWFTFFSLGVLQVKRQNSPVIDADVEALIVAGNKKWTVRLLDNGNGGQHDSIPNLLRNINHFYFTSLSFHSSHSSGFSSHFFPSLSRSSRYRFFPSILIFLVVRGRISWRQVVVVAAVIRYYNNRKLGRGLRPLLLFCLLYRSGCRSLPACSFVLSISFSVMLSTNALANSLPYFLSRGTTRAKEIVRI